MTLPRLQAIYERWKKVPPLSVSMAAMVAAQGVKWPPPIAGGGATQAANKHSPQELFEALGGGGGGGFSTEKPAWLKKT